MPFRIATFLIASAGGALVAGLLSQWRQLWIGAWFGALLWLLLDAWRAQQLVQALREDTVGLGARRMGVWGEIAERARKLLRVREQQTQQAEERLKEFLAAIQASPNGVILIDDQGRIEWCNQTAALHLDIDAERDLQQHLSNLAGDPAFVAYLASWNW